MSEAARQRVAVRVVTQLDKIATAWEPKYQEAAAKVFERERRTVQAILDESKRLALRQKATVDWKRVVTDVQRFYAEEAGDDWRETFVPLVRATIEDQGKALNTAYGMTFSVRDLLAESWLEDYTLKFAQPIVETSSRELSQLLQQAQAEGWSISETQRHLNEVFRQWVSGGETADLREWAEARIPPLRTESIARTEAMRASGAGSYHLYRDWGVQRKQWWASIDGREREAHKLAHKQIVAIDKPFIVGGEELMYPLDPAGSAQNTIRCRCTVLPVMDASMEPRPSSRGNPIDASVIGLEKAHERATKDADAWADNVLSSSYDTMSLQRYQSGEKYLDYREINDYLRTGKVSKLSGPPGDQHYGGKPGTEAKELALTVDSIQGSILNKAAVVPQDVVAYRGGDSGMVNAITQGAGEAGLNRLVGKTITDKGFVSSSLDRAVAEERYEPGGVVMRINIPKGMHAAYASHPKVDTMEWVEYEYMLPHGSNFRVDGVRKGTDGVTQMDVTVVKEPKFSGSSGPKGKSGPTVQPTAVKARRLDDRFLWRTGDVAVTD